MDTSNERRIEKVREELEKLPAVRERWRSQLKVVAHRARRFTNARNLLEIGCGCGALRDHLEGIQYAGIDPIECKDAAFDFRIGYGESIPHQNGTFDLVLIKDTANYFRELDPVIVEAMRVLKPGGAILFTEDVGANYRPGLQKAKNLIKKHLHVRRNIWDKTYSNYYTSHDILKAARRLGLTAHYEYVPSDLRYFVTVERTVSR
jgi:SAM-dependent methyltransferase